MNLNGVENVYTQHEPLLSYPVESFLKTRQFKDSTYPNLMSQSASGRTNELIVFVVGGVTFEEATKIAKFNATYPGKFVN